MDHVEYLIIGGGVAGTTAAEEIRRRDSGGTIMMIMEEPETLYSRVLLPHYLRNERSLDELFFRKPEWYDAQRIRLRRGVRAASINGARRSVTLSTGEVAAGEKLLIASGGKVNTLTVPGGDLPGITYLRTIEDARLIKTLLADARRGIVVGGGFIGVEYAQTFVVAGLETTCVVRDPYFWSTVVGEHSGRLINVLLEDHGVRIFADAEVAEFRGRDRVESVLLKSGAEIAGDIVGVGVGIHMDLDHLRESGLKINRGVVTNEYLETETEHVWAAGDIAEFFDVIFNRAHQLGNWTNAQQQGRIAGQNMVAGWGETGRDRTPFATVSTYTISIFGVPFTFIGDPAIGPDVTLVERGSVESGRMARLHIRGNVLIGASLLNFARDRQAAVRLIEQKSPISIPQDELRNPDFTLDRLLPPPETSSRAASARS